MGPLGLQETIVIFVLALLVFGPKKLPELGKTIGKAMTEFRRASSELKATWDREMTQLEREQEALKEETRKVEGEVNSAYNSGGYHDDGYGSYDYDSGYNYGSEGNPSTASDTTTVGATEPQGAEQTAANTAADGESAGAPDTPAAVAEAAPAPPPGEGSDGKVSAPAQS